MRLKARNPKGRFWRISAAGIFFQGGAAAVDSSTIIAALVHGLTGSAYAIGAAAAILRYGWLFPQLFVAYFAQRRRRRMPIYMLGAFGRATCLAALAGLLAMAHGLPGATVTTLFFGLWFTYSFVSGIVAVPYNDIVARSVPSGRRSRLLAVRFFGGSLLALGVAAAAHQFLAVFPFPTGYAVIVFLEQCCCTHLHYLSSPPASLACRRRQTIREVLLLSCAKASGCFGRTTVSAFSCIHSGSVEL